MDDRGLSCAGEETLGSAARRYPHPLGRAGARGRGDRRAALTLSLSRAPQFPTASRSHARERAQRQRRACRASSPAHVAPSPPWAGGGKGRGDRRATLTLSLSRAPQFPTASRNHARERGQRQRRACRVSSPALGTWWTTGVYHARERRHSARREPRPPTVPRPPDVPRSGGEPLPSPPGMARAQAQVRRSILDSPFPAGSR